MSHINKSIVENWFGEKFYTLHPLLQKLHLNGGRLKGKVDISYGNGIAGLIGRRLTKKLNIPSGGIHQLVVNISHHSDGLHWDRNFDGKVEMKSVFTPVGTSDRGHWVEKTGPLQILLTVDTSDGGWSWQCLGFKLLGASLPVWMFPRTNAYKAIENDKYRFYVGFFMPILGKLFSYSGLLSAEYAEE
jgi:hypothetical protein